ncbi:MAG TPA: hypothetical protein VMS86_10815 [Thermoanaerobaculia bacterium]|nr:hypothetical protein [Thermoanaerobaculia bacterium]
MLALALVAAAAVALYLLEELSTSGRAGLPLDDGWIHLQFARSLASGGGLSYRPGTLVSGSTAPLWTALVSLAFAAPGPLLAWVKLLGFALYLAGAAVSYALARELGLGQGAAGFVALLYLVTDAMVWSALSGMEVGLFVTLAVGAVVVHLRERRAARPAAVSLALPLFGLASLARPEGLLLLALAAADRVLFPHPGTTRRSLLPGLAIGAACALALVATVQVFSLAVSDSPLPTTYAVKTDGPRTLLPSGLYLLRVVGVLFRPHPLLVLLAAAGALALLERLGTARDRGLLPALWTAGLPLAYSLYDAPGAPMMVGNFGRYFFPLLPFVLVLGALALERPLERLGTARRGWRVAAGAILAAALLVPPLSGLVSGSVRYGRNVRDVNQSDVAMALWIRRHLPPEAVVAAQDVGAVGFFTPNPLVDLTGIVTPEILPWLEGSAATAGGRDGLVRFLAERRPDYLLLFAESYPGLLEALAAEVVHRVRLERNVTMAGSDLVLARPAWDRAPLLGDDRAAQVR